MAYLTASFPMTLSYIHPISSLFKCDFSYSSAAVNKISTDDKRRAVPLRQLNFLLLFIIFLLWFHTVR